MKRKTLGSGMDRAQIMAEADPTAKIRNAIEPPHVRALRQQNGKLDETADRLRQALGGATSDHSGIVSAVDRYRSPARDALDIIRARDPLQRATDQIRAGALSVHPIAAPRDTDTVRSVADIGHRVREARRAMGMTQQRFADIAGVGRRFLVELEKGKPSLEIGRVLAVCQAAGLKLAIAR